MQTELLQLSDQLHQESLFITSERVQIIELNKEISEMAARVLKEAWVAYQHRRVLRMLRQVQMRGSIQMKPSECLGRSVQLDNTSFVKGFKHLAHHECKYVSLFKFLMTNPRVLASCLAQGDPHTAGPSRRSTVDKHPWRPVMVDVVVGSLFGANVMPQDEVAFADLLIALVDAQVLTANEPRNVIRRNTSFFHQLYQQFTETSYAAKMFLVSALHQPLLRALTKDDTYLDLDPDRTLSRMTAEQKMALGFPGTPQFRAEMETHRNNIVTELVTMTNAFLSSIKASLCCFPLHLGRIVTHIYRKLLENHDVHIARQVCADLIFEYFICHALLYPEEVGLTSDAPVSDIARHNLMQVASVLQLLSMSQQRSVSPKLQEVLGRLDKDCLLEVIENMTEAHFPRETFPGSDNLPGSQSRTALFITLPDLNTMVEFLRANANSLSEDDESRKLALEQLAAIPLNTIPITSLPPPPPARELAQGGSPSTGRSKTLKKKTSMDSTHELSLATRVEEEDVLIVTLEETVDVGLSSEQKVMSEVEVEVDRSSNQTNPGSIKRTRFSLSHDQESIATASEFGADAMSEAASVHSVESTNLEDNDEDNLSDMVSANVSGRGSPNISGRDTPTSQGGAGGGLDDGDENRQTSAGTANIPVTVKTENQNMSERFGKFDIAPQISMEEARSTVSDTWSLDVLASDSEPPEHQYERLSEVLEQEQRMLFEIREISETASESAWSTDVLASDTSERPSERLWELESNLDSSAAQDTESEAGEHQRREDVEVQSLMDNLDRAPRRLPSSSPRYSPSSQKHSYSPAGRSHRLFPSGSRGSTQRNSPLLYPSQPFEGAVPRARPSSASAALSGPVCMGGSTGNLVLGDSRFNRPPFGEEASARGAVGGVEPSVIPKTQSMPSATMCSNEGSASLGYNKNRLTGGDNSYSSSDSSLSSGATRSSSKFGGDDFFMSDVKAPVNGVGNSFLQPGPMSAPPAAVLRSSVPFRDSGIGSSTNPFKDPALTSASRPSMGWTGEPSTLFATSDSPNGSCKRNTRPDSGFDPLTPMQTVPLRQKESNDNILAYFDPLAETPSEGADSRHPSWSGSQTETGSLMSEPWSLALGASATTEHQPADWTDSDWLSSGERPVATNDPWAIPSEREDDGQAWPNNTTPVKKPPPHQGQGEWLEGDKVSTLTNSTEGSKDTSLTLVDSESKLGVWSDGCVRPKEPQRMSTLERSGSPNVNLRKKKHMSGGKDGLDSSSSGSRGLKKQLLSSLKSIRLGRKSKKSLGGGSSVDTVGDPDDTRASEDGSTCSDEAHGGSQANPLSKKLSFEGDIEEMLAKYHPVVSRSYQDTQEQEEVVQSLRRLSIIEMDAAPPEPIYNPTNFENCLAFKDAKKKLRLILSARECLTARRLLLSSQRQGGRREAKNDIISFVELLLTEATSSLNRALIAQLHETLRCFQEFSKKECRKIVKTMREDHKARVHYITYLTRSRMGLLSTRSLLQRLEQVLNRETAIHHRCFVSSFVLIYLSKMQEPLLKLRREFPLKTISDEKRRALDACMNYIFDDISTDSIWSVASEQHIDTAHLVLERCVMGEVYRNAMFPNGEIDIGRDQIFSDHVRQLGAHLKPDNKHLDIPLRYHLECPWPSAQAELRLVSVFKTPRDKLACIQRCFDIISNLLALAHDNVPAADDIFPVFAYVLIKANPPHMLSTEQFINTFHGEERMESQEQYWWATFCSTIAFVKMWIQKENKSESHC